MLKDFLNYPIPAYKAFAGLAVAGTGTVITYLAAKDLLVKADRTIEDQNQRLRIYGESLEYLLARADDATLKDLNKNLDFWRVIRGMAPTQKPEDEA